MSQGQDRNALLRRSDALARAREWGNEAEEVNRQLLRADSQCAVAFTRLGKILFDRGDHDEAEQIYMRALELDPSNAIARGGLRRIEESRRPPPLEGLDDEALHGHFPSPDDVAPARWVALERLKAEGRHKRWSERDREIARRYQGLFSPEGFRDFSPGDFLQFYRMDALANIGNASLVADSYVKELGPDEYGRRAKEAIQYLLFEETPGLEQRLTDLIDGKNPPAVPGVKEAIPNEGPGGGLARSLLPCPRLRLARRVGEAAGCCRYLRPRAASAGSCHLDHWPVDHLVEHPLPRYWAAAGVPRRTDSGRLHLVGLESTAIGEGPANVRMIGMSGPGMLCLLEPIESDLPFRGCALRTEA
jgi:hypothetical protein